MRDLKDIFEKFKGQTVMDPDRGTRDVCPVSADLQSAVTADNICIVFAKAGEISGFSQEDIDYFKFLEMGVLQVNITQNDQQDWVIDSFDLN